MIDNILNIPTLALVMSILATMSIHVASFMKNLSFKMKTKLHYSDLYKATQSKNFLLTANEKIIFTRYLWSRIYQQAPNEDYVKLGDKVLFLKKLYSVFFTLSIASCLFLFSFD